jgi:hypothetical protein
MSLPNGVHHRSLLLVISTLQPLKSMRQDLNITWAPGPVLTKLGTCIMLHNAISTEYFINSSHQSYQHSSFLNYCCNNFNISWVPQPIAMELGVYHAIWDHLIGVLHKFLRSVIPTLQPLKLFRPNLYIARTNPPVLVYISCHIIQSQ